MGPDHDHRGHNDHDGHSAHAAVFRRQFWASLVLSVPIFAYSETIQNWFNFTSPSFAGDGLVAPLLGMVVFFYGGWVFLAGGWGELRARHPGMMLLISLAISVSFLASVATELGAFDHEFWWELAGLVVVMLLGHWQEMRALGQARSALDALADLLPDEAERIGPDGAVDTLAVEALVVGDLVLVRPGGRVPADGVVVDGAAEVDESMLTGESRPVAKTPGEQVVAGTVVTDTALRVRVAAVGGDTALAGIQRLVSEAEASRSRTQALADRAAALLFYVATGTAVVTFVVWTLLGDPADAVTRTVTVLVISCPHALGLAIPLVIAISTALGARQGMLIKDRLALEQMRHIDVVLFDKTGTLTLGAHKVTDIATSIGHSGDDVLGVAAAVETDSEHPLARAIASAAAERALSVPVATEFRARSGRGVHAIVNGVEIAVGGPAMLAEADLVLPQKLDEPTTLWRNRGASVLHVVADGHIVGALALEDEIRPESRQAVDHLHRLGVNVAMITGDADQVADAVAADLGIDEVFAQVLPEDKDHKVAELQARGLTVAMVGDGVNDAPALARADVGIAIGAGTDVAIESAGIVLASDDPRSVVAAITLSRASYRKMIQNLAWATGYNLLAIPLAAGVLASIGFVLPPAVGALLMSLSTIIVALNAQTLRRTNLATPSTEPTALARHRGA